MADRVMWEIISSALASSLLVSVAAFALSVPYKKWIEAKIGNGFDKRIEQFRADIRHAEEDLRTKLRQQEDEITTLRSGALSNLGARQIELTKRRLVAIENLWNAVVELGKYAMGSRYAQAINFEAALEESEKQSRGGEGTRQLAAMLLKSSNLENINLEIVADRERPFVPELAWAVFSVYRQIIFIPILKLNAIKVGLGPKILTDSSHLIKAAKIALPEYENYIDERGETGLYFLIDVLQDRLLLLLREALDSPAGDIRAVEQAAKIITEVKAYTKQRNDIEEVANQMNEVSGEPWQERPPVATPP